MLLLLFVLIFGVCVLSMIGSLNAGAAFFISVCCLAGMVLQVRQKHIMRQQLNRRRVALQAKWGLQVKHLGGLPLPVDTLGSLFFLGDRLILETEHDLWTFKLEDLRKILLMTSDQIYKVDDRQLCNLLLAGSSRTLAALREKIRHHDSALHHSSILLITYQPEASDTSLLVLASAVYPQKVTSLLKTNGLADKVSVRLHGQQVNVI
ncbi:MAG: hypothetical protein VB070_02495 [Clostridiaceae bacterium]|nr:hypothetical protein [Clostridiaceae bacterium]